MPRYVAFLRAINVGGHVVTMDALRKSFVRIGLDDVETFIASGNVMFASRVTDTARLETEIEERLRRELGYDVATFVRTVENVASIARYQPFPAAALGQAAALNVGFVAEPLPAAARTAIAALATAFDSFHVKGREWYWLCKNKQSKSTISNAIVERTLKVRSTLRGMNTIVRLAAKLEAGVPREGR